MGYVVFKSPARTVESLNPDYSYLELLGDPPPKDWSAFKLYPSWMRQVSLHEWSLGEKIYAPIYLLVDGSRRYNVYLGTSLSSISLASTYSSLRIGENLYRSGVVMDQYTGFPRAILQTLNGYWWTTTI